MMWRWISEVPSQIRSTRASRQKARDRQVAPSGPCRHRSGAPHRSPAPASRRRRAWPTRSRGSRATPGPAARRLASVSQSAASISVTMSASWKLTPWKLARSAGRTAAGRSAALGSAMVEDPPRAAHAHRRHGDPRRVEPLVHHRKTAIDLAEHLGCPAAGNRRISGCSSCSPGARPTGSLADLEPRMPRSTRKQVIRFFGPWASHPPRSPRTRSRNPRDRRRR